MIKLSFRNFYFRWVKNLLSLSLLFVLLMSISRAGFAVYFGDMLSLASNADLVASAMWLGLRYDLMPVAYVMVLPFLIINIAYFFPGLRTIATTRALVVSLLTLGLYAIGWIFLCDYGYYSYFQDHINILFFGLFEDDTVAVLTSIWKNYNLPLWLFFFFTLHYMLYRLILLMFSPFEFDLKVKNFDARYPLYFLGGIVLIAYSARGNFGRLPLSIEDSYISSNEFINDIPVNGPIALNRAIKIRKIFGKGGYDYLAQNGYKSWQDAYRDVFGDEPLPDLAQSLVRKVPLNPIIEKQRPHVVLVVMESFGTYWIDQNSSNFDILGDLKDQFHSGMLFKNFLSAENGTIGSIVSVATSQVIRPGARFLSESEFMSTQLTSAGQLPYKQSGYETHFVYGGKLGWRDLGKYLKGQGYDRLWGADEIKNASPEIANRPYAELGNEWGIFDEHLYHFIQKKLDASTTPQFFLVLTTSNHPPFEYPRSYVPRTVELNAAQLEKMTVREELARKRFEGLQYANQKMAEFLKQRKENTVMALTGDHSFWIAKGVGLEDEFRRYSVPFFISAPAYLRPKSVDLENFGSHEDIFPTLYHLTLSNQEYVSMGEDLISKKGHAMNSSGLIANEKGAYHHGRFWKWKDKKKLILEETKSSLELEHLVRYQAGLIGLTDVYLKSEKSSRQTASESDPQ